MKILVFGKTGQVASALSAYQNVTCIGRDEADLTDPQSCTDAIQTSNADIIINAAAYTAVDKAESETETAMLVNGVTPGAMAQAAAKWDIPFLHISTDYVFDGTGDQPWGPIDTANPVNVYGKSKLDGEKSIQAVGGKYVILRTSWIYSSTGTNFVKTMLHLSQTRNALSVVNDQIGGPTSATDIAAVLIKIAKHLHKGKGTSGIYHFTSTPPTSWANFAEAIFQMTDRSVAVTGIPSSEYPTPASRPMNSCLDCSDLTKDYGIEIPDWPTSLKAVLKDLGELS